MTMESTRCAAAAVPAHPNVLDQDAGAPCIVFELYDHFWECECCGGIYDMALTLRVNGVEVRSWYEDGHFGDTRIDWPEALALALGHAGARLTIQPLPNPLPDADVGPYTLIAWPATQDPIVPVDQDLSLAPTLALPVPLHELVWTDVEETTPDGGCNTRTHVLLNGEPVTVWREEDHWDEPLHAHGPVVESLHALGASVSVVTIDAPTDEDDVPDDEDMTDIPPVTDGTAIQEPHAATDTAPDGAP